MLLSGAGQFEGVGHDAIARTAGKDILLDHHLKFCVAIEASTCFGVLALTVFPNDDEVDVSGVAAAEWAGYSFQQARGAAVHILVESAADRDQEAPQRSVVGYSGIADRSQIDGVERA